MQAINRTVVLVQGMYGGEPAMLYGGGLSNQKDVR